MSGRAARKLFRIIKVIQLMNHLRAADTVVVDNEAALVVDDGDTAVVEIPVV